MNNLEGQELENIEKRLAFLTFNFKKEKKMLLYNQLKDHTKKCMIRSRVKRCTTTLLRKNNIKRIVL